MNAINTSSSGPPTSVAPAQPVTPPGARSATKPATTFKALLSALGATDAGTANGATTAATILPDVSGATSGALADVGGAVTTAADVTSAGDMGSVATRSYSQSQLPDGAPASGRRRHDESAPSPVLTFGVPVTIAAIPIASLTIGSVARPPTLAVGVTPTALPVAQGNGAVDSVSAATLSASANVVGTPPDSAAMATAATVSAAALPTAMAGGSTSASPVAPTDGQSGSVTFTPVAKAAVNVASASGTALPPGMTATAPTSSSFAGGNVGVMATAKNADAAAVAVAPAAAPLTPARHTLPDAVPTDAWAANIGPVTNTSPGITTVSPPTHPAVTGASQQIATQATLLHNGQSAEMQLRLRPPDLGDVRVILRRDATGALSAHLVPATREAGDVLNANLHHLRNALDPHSQGQRAEVSVGQHNVADQRQHMNGGHSSHEDETSASDPATPSSKSNQPAAQRISRAVAPTGAVDYDA